MCAEVLDQDCAVRSWADSSLTSPKSKLGIFGHGVALVQYYELALVAAAPEDHASGASETAQQIFLGSRPDPCLPEDGLGAGKVHHLPPYNIDAPVVGGIQL